MSEYYTVKKSIEYTGLSESTIRRIIKKLKKASQAEQVEGIQEGIQILKTEYLRGNEANLIHKSYLDRIKRSFDNSQEDSQKNNEHGQDYIQGIHSENSQPVQDSSQDMIIFLMAQLKAKDEQLKEKDEQLKRKDEHIDQMLERQRESNLLIGSLQNKVLLLEKGKDEIVNESSFSSSPSSAPIKTEKNVKKPKNGKKNAEQPIEINLDTEKKGGFWSSITSLFK